MIRLFLRLAFVGGAVAWVLDRILGSRAGDRPPEPIRVSITIHAPIERVWGVLTDIAGQPRWMDEVKAVRMLTPPPVGVGTRAECDIRLLGIGMLDPIEVTHFEPPTRFAVRHVGQFSGDGVVKLEASDDGRSTTAGWEETIVPPYFPRLGGLVLALVLRRVFQRDLANLRQLIESGTDRS